MESTRWPFLPFCLSVPPFRFNIQRMSVFLFWVKEPTNGTGVCVCVLGGIQRNYPLAACEFLLHSTMKHGSSTALPTVLTWIM